MSDFVYITKQYTFSAVHSLPAAECRTRHGHLYQVRVTLHSRIDPATGLAVNREFLDQVMSQNVLADFNGSDLNQKLGFSSGENICAKIKERLTPFFANGTKIQVSLQETRKNWFSST